MDKREVVVIFLKKIEESGTGKFTSYDIEEEVDLINKKSSKLSSIQRNSVLLLQQKLRKG